MKDEHVNLRMTSPLKNKLAYISEKEDRSLSAQIERFAKQGVKEWIKKNGPITFEKPQ